eukprot:CAMPEP_0119015000 /NCGR_PEP_ID=MMETSP1176-20130426/10502_1 /TAXON_ID=265551 /ORGANISM="Synedropsis recta cf, Strain CCMP1620" /LENGTH=364 /DNA_ID=CAMNT_0006968257 /DNA_START=22 /DNA_END=1116 /DNA_ORIENTATION=+
MKLLFLLLLVVVTAAVDATGHRRSLQANLTDEERYDGDDDDANPTHPPTHRPTYAPVYHPTPYPTPHPTYPPTPDPTYHPTPDPTAHPTPHPTPARTVCTWSGIQLLPSSEVAPFEGVHFTSGKADIDLIYEEDRPNSEYIICIQATICGFTPELLHIHAGEIFQNGAVFADLTALLTGGGTTDGCVETTKEFYTMLVNDPDKFYLNAHVAPTPDSLFFQGIRGQLLQSFTSQLDAEASVAPFLGVHGSSGVSSIRFEAGGSIVCFDATIVGFDPEVAHLAYGVTGTNGNVVYDFSSLKVAPGRFFGCLSIEELGTTLAEVCEILADGYVYYFDFHQSDIPDSIYFFNTIRGQLPEVIPLSDII